MVFLIDVPRLADAAEHQPTAFSSKLSRFLLACQVDEKLVHSLTNYDFSQTAQLGFVHTMFVTPYEKTGGLCLATCSDDTELAVWMEEESLTKMF